MHPFFRLRRLFVLLWASPAALLAAVTPSALFQDHAVLQRDKPVPVWGTAAPAEKVTVSFAGQSVAAVAGADGRWSVTLAPLAANATPAALTITGENTVVLSDIVVGEVWLASGQSNMEWIVNNSHDADLERLVARFPLIREIKVRKTTAGSPASGFSGEWRVASPETVGTFGAVAYAFAKDLHLALDVPVGIVNSTWGGTPIESWMSPAALDSDPAFAAVRERWAKVLAEYPAKKSAYDAELSAWNEEKAAAAARDERFTKASPRPPAGPDSPNAPSSLHHGMIAPLLPAALRGVIWYQGESNASRAEEYASLFPALIRGWRADFGQGDFPFFWAQLAGHRASRTDLAQWAELRAAQTRALALPATGQAILADAELSDFGDIHPRAKIPVGRRLARLALARTYGFEKLADSGPVFAGIEPVVPAMPTTPPISATPVDPATSANSRFDAAAVNATDPALAAPAALRVLFTGGTGRLRNPARTLSGFEVAGEDRVFHPADARLENGAVIVESAAVPAPVVVRYAWANHPGVTLQDDLGLPVPPFRSDTGQTP